MMLSVTRWLCWSALAVTQTAPFLWGEINTSSQLIKACEILQSSLGVSGLSFLTQILSPLPGCHGQACWATLCIQRKLPPLRWQFQVRESDTETGTCLRAYFHMHLIMQMVQNGKQCLLTTHHHPFVRVQPADLRMTHKTFNLALCLLPASLLIWKQQAVVPVEFWLWQRTFWSS